MVHPTKTDSELMTIKQKERHFFLHSVQSIISTTAGDRLKTRQEKWRGKGVEGGKKTPNNKQFCTNTSGYTKM